MLSKKRKPIFVVGDSPMTEKNWYNLLKIGAGFASDPFGPSELSDKTRNSPWGHMGGDSHTGILEPSQGNHHPSDYFAEGDDTVLTEKRLRDKLKKERKRRLLNQLLKKRLKKNKLKTHAQWGESGPKVPRWTDENWVLDTYNKMQSQDKPTEQQQQPQKEIPQDSSNIIDLSLQSTISVKSVVGEQMEIGSGFIIGNKTILTCAHVVLPGQEQNIKQTNITVSDGNQEYPASIWAYDQPLDVAVLVINDPNFNLSAELKLGDSTNLKQGEDILIVGTPLGFENVLGKGIISSKPTGYEEKGETKEYIFISTNISPGNSGGPVVKSSDASVIGIVAAVISEEGGAGGLNAAIPINNIKSFLSNNGINFSEA